MCLLQHQTPLGAFPFFLLLFWWLFFFFPSQNYVEISLPQISHQLKKKQNSHLKTASLEIPSIDPKHGSLPIKLQFLKLKILDNFRELFHFFFPFLFYSNTFPVYKKLHLAASPRCTAIKKCRIPAILDVVSVSSSPWHRDSSHQAQTTRFTKIKTAAEPWKFTDTWI